MFYDWSTGASSSTIVPPLPPKDKRKKHFDAALAIPAPAPKPTVAVRRQATLELHKRRAAKTQGLVHLASEVQARPVSAAAAAKTTQFDIKKTLDIEKTNPGVKEVPAHKVPPATKQLREQLGVLRKDPTGSQPLHTAAANGNLRACRALLTAGADATASNTFGSTALHYAAANGRPAVAVLLLHKGAELGARTGGGKTPMMYAKERVPFTSVSSAAQMLCLLTAARRAKAQGLPRENIVAAADAAYKVAAAAVELGRQPTDPIAAPNGVLPEPVEEASAVAGAAASLAIAAR